MNKLLLATTILGASAGGVLALRQSTTHLLQEANAVREAWVTQTERIENAGNEQASLTKRVHELKQAAAQPLAVVESAVWSALQTNRADRLPPELRERLFEELGLNWTSSPEFILVSKRAVFEVNMRTIWDGELTDVATTVLALTAEERGRVEAAMQHAQNDYKDWALANVERSEPKDDVVAQYTLPADPAMAQSISNNFATDLLGALGRERAELILPYGRAWMASIGIRAKPLTIIVKRSPDDKEPGLTFQRSGSPDWHSLKIPLSREFRPIFPNGWADVAKAEGFELPQEPPQSQ